MAKMLYNVANGYIVYLKLLRCRMKIAVIGSRNLLPFDLGKYIPESVSEIISGGAKGVDSMAKNYAITHNIILTEYLPEYNRYGKGAPLKRNIKIIEEANRVIAFWDGKSKGTKFVIDECRKRGKEIDIVLIDMHDSRI